MVRCGSAVKLGSMHQKDSSTMVFLFPVGKLNVKFRTSQTDLPVVSIVGEAACVSDMIEQKNKAKVNWHYVIKEHNHIHVSLLHRMCAS